MKEIRRTLLVLWIGLCLLPAGGFAAGDQDAPSVPVEIIIQGKKYKSIRAYKRAQIKSTLKKSLSSHNLKEFSEDELFEIMKEVRTQQAEKKSSRIDLGEVWGSSDEDGTDQQLSGSANQSLSASEMQEMLQQYQREHGGGRSLLIDPGKVKSIIIDPKK